jgi:hypothetical protein
MGTEMSRRTWSWGSGPAGSQTQADGLVAGLWVCETWTGSICSHRQAPQFRRRRHAPEADG